MRDRIDALGRDRSRFEALSGALLSDEPDEELQRLVRAAADVARTPIGLVSLVLDRVQFFRAHVGLPEDLAVARATDRDASFCQLVVRDEEPLEVVCAGDDDRVPQELVRRYGIQSYYGLPVRAKDNVVGSLCVIDVEPRQFDPGQRDQLRALSLQVSRRLGELAGLQKTAVERHRQLLAECASPAFAEIRNQLVPLMAHNASLKLAVAELAPLARLARAGQMATVDSLAVLTRAAQAAEDVERIPFEQDLLISAIVDAVIALENVAVPSHGATLLADVFETSAHLAHHHTKLVGGVRWPEVDASARVAASKSEACMALATLIASIGLATSQSAHRSELRPRYEHRDGQHLVAFSTPAASGDDDAVGSAVRAIGTLLVDRDDLALLIEPELVILRLRGA